MKETLTKKSELETGYKYGFTTDIESVQIPKGINADTVRLISSIKKEPKWVRDFRLKGYRSWVRQKHPEWQKLNIPEIDFQDIVYYSAPKGTDEVKTLDDLPQEILETYEKLGIPLQEVKQLEGIAVDAVFDSVSVGQAVNKALDKVGVIFCPISEAIKKYPDLVKKYLGSVVPANDNFYAALNTAAFSDGSFVYIPPDTRCPLELSTYFRLNEANTGQFERTLIIADKGSYVSYLEGCSAPMRKNNQLHSAIVEIIALDHAEVKYSTVQNWWPGDEETGEGGVLNFVTKRGICYDSAKISWNQVETGSAITWKYPSCILKGDNSVGEFYSVAVTKGYQQADTGTKMIHIGKNTKSTIVSKGISAGKGQNTYRGGVKVMKGAKNGRNFTQCDSLLIGGSCGAHTFPYIDVRNPTFQQEHEATTSNVSDEQLFYCRQRGLSTEDAVSMIVGGFCNDVFNKLPMEFAVEANQLLAVSLEGTVG
jgi:Fe-S cluster assembly protein SufB